MRGIRARRLGNSIRARLKRPAIFTLVTVLLLLVMIIAYVISNIGSMVVELALADATDVITITVNDVISEKVMDGSIDYSDLVTLEKDADGNITALLTNMANVNYLQSEITGEIVKRFSDMDVTRVDIPIGNLIGGTLLSGRGPKISVDILSVTNVSATLRNELIRQGTELYFRWTSASEYCSQDTAINGMTFRQRSRSARLLSLEGCQRLTQA